MNESTNQKPRIMRNTTKKMEYVIESHIIKGIQIKNPIENIQKFRFYFTLVLGGVLL
jgi:hypothetical protein